MRRPSTTLSALLLTLLTACDRGPVEWRGAAARFAGQGAGDVTSPHGARLVLRPDGSTAVDAVVATPTPAAAGDTAACTESVRTAAATPKELYGLWWTRRAGGTAALVAARSDDAGATWTAAVPVDTTDRWAVACARPAPAIAADSASGYVHVTYFLHGPSGPGVFFSHSMERGELFHSPVPIMYGARPSRSSVAAADSVVVVAFEDPNSERSRISLAMSRTWGHIFVRERPEASSAETRAESPLVAVRDTVVAVGWRGQDQSLVTRVGTLKHQ